MNAQESFEYSTVALDKIIKTLEKFNLLSSDMIPNIVILRQTIQDNYDYQKNYVE